MIAHSTENAFIVKYFSLTVIRPKLMFRSFHFAAFLLQRFFNRREKEWQFDAWYERRSLRD